MTLEELKNAGAAAVGNIAAARIARWPAVLIAVQIGLGLATIASGRSAAIVTFHTGVAMVHAPSGRLQSALVPVTSTFRTLRDDEIEAYLDREAPYDCAGGVKSEALGIALFDSIASDDPTALIGLPLIAVCRMLRAEGLDPLLGPATFAA